ncbi:MAG: DUF4150 domain-containing protein [Minicystis sp.]
MSELAVSIGDEPGTDGGVTSGTYTKEATWITSSLDVKIEGKGACRHSDKMLHNHGNTMNAGGFVNGEGNLTCKEMWARIDAETAPIINEPDHQVRNKLITEKYAALYKRHPEYEWAGLAGVVSRQAGCHMADAQEARQNSVGGGDDALVMPGTAKTAYNALGEANRSIFGNIYPNHRFYELYGWDGVQRCGDAEGRRIPDKLKEAFKKMEEAKSKTGPARARALREASNRIAEHEQLIVVQKAVYGKAEFAAVLSVNEYWSSGWRAPLGSLFGATWPQLAYSAQCGQGKPIIFDGSINDPTDRVNFYHKLMNEWLRQRDANPAAWQQMYNDILNWSRTSSIPFFPGGGSFGGAGANGNW